MKSIEAWAIVDADIAQDIHGKFYIFSDKADADDFERDGERVVRVKIEWEE